MMNRLKLASGRRSRIYAVLLLLLLFLLASVSASYAAPEAWGSVYHTVQPGENLSQIAYRYGTSISAILGSNPYITNPNLIYVGTVLVIPAAPPPAAGYYPGYPGYSCRFSHIVRYGDHLIGLGRHYGVSPFAIAEANNIYNLNYIFAGQYLCIP